MYTPTSDAQWCTGLTSLGPTLIKSNLGFFWLLWHVSQLGMDTASLAHIGFDAHAKWLSLVRTRTYLQFWNRVFALAALF